MNTDPTTLLVATIISSGAIDLTDQMIAQFTSLLRSNEALNIERQWVVPGKVIDIFFTNMQIEKAYAFFNISFPARPYDVIIQPVENRSKKLLVADMESTMIEQEMLDEIAALLGLNDKIAALTLRAMRGEMDFATALRARAELLGGEQASLLAEAMKTITPMKGAVELVAAMKKNGAQCWLVTGGFTCFADEVGQRLGFDRVFANHLEVVDAKITGRVHEPILDKDSKRDYLMRACHEHKLALAESLAIGDGANDLPMIVTCTENLGLGVAYHAKPAVRAATPHQINHANLTALIYAQGLAI